MGDWEDLGDFGVLGDLGDLVELKGFLRFGGFCIYNYISAVSKEGSAMRVLKRLFYKRCKNILKHIEN